jgi:cytohesin
MKHLLLTTIAAVVLVGCGPSVDIWTGAQTGNIEAVKQHLADGVDVNSKSDIGRTPLDVATAFKQRLITDLLRKHGGKTRDELKAAESIVVAVELGDIEAVKQHLSEGTEVNAKGGTGRTPLHWAAIEGHKEIAELLIAEGADVGAKTNDGKTPLDEAINPFYNKTEIARLLRKHGGKHGTIHSVVGGDDVEAVKEFLAAGADVNVKDKRGFTPLHWASISGHKEAVELLIDNGADVNAMRGGGATSLSYASSWGHEEIVKLLIANGADVNVKDAFSETPLDVAIHPDNPNASAETADILRKHGGKTKKELEVAGN